MTREITGTWHVLAVNNVDISASYFQDILNFKLESSHHGWRFLSNGVFRIMLGECIDEVPASQIGNHSYIAYIDVADVDALFSQYQANGVTFTQCIADKPWGMREFGVITPDGHRIMFGQPLPSD